MLSEKAMCRVSGFSSRTGQAATNYPALIVSCPSSSRRTSLAMLTGGLKPPMAQGRKGAWAGRLLVDGSKRNECAAGGLRRGMAGCRHESDCRQRRRQESQTRHWLWLSRDGMWVARSSQSVGQGGGTMVMRQAVFIFMTTRMLDAGFGGLMPYSWSDRCKPGGFQGMA